QVQAAISPLQVVVDQFAYGLKVFEWQTWAALCDYFSDIEEPFAEQHMTQESIILRLREENKDLDTVVRSVLSHSKIALKSKLILMLLDLIKADCPRASTTPESGIHSSLARLSALDSRPTAKVALKAKEVMIVGSLPSYEERLNQLEQILKAATTTSYYGESGKGHRFPSTDMLKEVTDSRYTVYDVLTTCSPENFEFVRGLGARQAFDYRSATVVADLVRALGQSRCAGAVAIGAGAAFACLDLVVAAGGALTVAVVTPPATFDGIPAGRGRLRKLLPILASNASGLLKLMWRAKRHGVATPFVWGTALMHNHVGPLIFQDYLPEALARGAFQPSPPCQVAGHGLEAIPAAMAMHAAGVSAVKLVVTL
ncbi:MAG: hypothetical protein EOO80_04700, partial [Oxalobacteraceae bacterium]